MQIQLATTEDWAQLVDLVAEAKQRMQANNIRQWTAKYPSDAVLAEDLAAQELWVFKQEQQVVCMGTLTQKSERWYQSTEPQPVWFLKRLIVKSSHEKCGLATLWLKQALALPMMTEAVALYACTHHSNQPMQQLFSNNQFQLRQHVLLAGRETLGKFCVYERKIGSHYGENCSIR